MFFSSTEKAIESNAVNGNVNGNVNILNGGGPPSYRNGLSGSRVGVGMNLNNPLHRFTEDSEFDWKMMEDEKIAVTKANLPPKTPLFYDEAAGYAKRP